MTRIVAVAPELPEYVYAQADITRELAPLISADPAQRVILERMHASTGIGTRHTALPLDRYRDLGPFGDTNDIFITVATNLAERALASALDSARLRARDVDFIMFTSVTGISAPSIDALLIPRLGLRSDVKRLPSFGLGCVAGAAGIARVHDYLVGHPSDIGVLISVELCSLTLQRADATMANFVATGLFGDGASAVVLAGEDAVVPGPRAATGPRVVDTKSAFYPDSAAVIGWNVKASGFEIVLTAGVADLIEKHFPEEVRSFLAGNGLTVDDIGCWLAHPGGPRVLEAFGTALGLPRSAFALSWASLEKVGNLSSSSVLHVLADAGTQPAGTRGVLFALGPGVSAEFVLLEWQ
ncbi:alkylresorcinol/alkylpyrone synthase [Cryobacterium mesophilum]|uniref:Type III polyketide synthase n=1 Tax=Terrimesophilobacter mesophilus TaxID=433647 RepID=A0A4R8VAV9_9MICO|nr:3-oxoacyl-[acyl-carrier-protein] synthase III C-terminal domain-containing protein [Terrimesophilobacter mesophilus]MBB5633171.1 alkylresorcinol/alkylpyrone synthase [Terrimesophilobacter mesophilus]TFB79923.1 type III polyketide synthase [Terrimesophilobacter mesophilus]